MSALTYEKNRKRFIFKCPYADRDQAKAAGFWWDPFAKTWYTEDLAIAARLRAHATDELKSKFDSFLIRVKPWSLPLLPSPPGLELMPHQVEAVHFALARNRCYLGLDPGLGKTIVAATVARNLKCPVVYVTPPFLMANVKEEFGKWAPETRLRLVPDSRLINDAYMDEVYNDTAFGLNWLLIVDEAHRFKNPQAKRTQVLLGSKHLAGFVDRFKRQIWMSGTPMPNRPIELFPILSKAAPETIDFEDQFHYALKYCGAKEGPWGWDFTGASNVPELASRVIAPTGPFMLRQKKALLNLPPKIEEVFVVSDVMPPRVAKMDKGIGETVKDVEDLLKHQLASVEGLDGDELHLTTYRRLLGYAKVEPTVEYVKTLLEETDEALIVFAYHRDVIEALTHELAEYEPLVITGDTPGETRHAYVKQYQIDKTRRVIIGNYLAMGVGFTLTKADREIFCEFDWVPGVNDQASDRAHRIGQNKTVLVQYVVYQNSLDKAVIETLLKKRLSIQHI